MQKISLVLLAVLLISTVAYAEEWIDFNEHGESAPIYDIKYSTNSLIEFEIEIPGMNSRDIDDYQRVWIPEHTKMDSVGYTEVPVVSFLIAIPEHESV